MEARGVRLLTPTGGHHHYYHQPRYLPLRPPAPPIVLALAQRFFSSSKHPGKISSAMNGTTPMDVSAATGDPFYVVRKGDVIGIYQNLAAYQTQVSNSEFNVDADAQANLAVQLHVGEIQE